MSFFSTGDQGSGVQGVGGWFGGGTKTGLQGGGALGGGGNGHDMFGMPDPMDIYGNRDAAQKAAQDKLLASNQAQIQAHLAAQPAYQTVQNADGSLQSPYSMSAATVASPTLGTAQTTDTAELDRRMGLAKDVSSTPIAGTFGQVQSFTAGNQPDVAAGQYASNAGDDLNRIRGDAFSTGPSAWATAANSQQDQQKQSALDQMGRDAATSTAQQQNNLAMTGGLEAGARERINRQTSNAQIMGQQGIQANDASQRNSIAMQDAQTKQSEQMALPGMGLQLDSYGTGLQAGNAARNQQNAQFNAQQQQAASGQNVSNAFGAAQFDASGNLAAQQYNSNLAMNQANMYQGAVQQNAGATQAASFANAGFQNSANSQDANMQNQANGMNTSTALGNNANLNAFNQNNWGMTGQVLGAQATAQQQAASQPTGGFFSKLSGGAGI